MTVEETEVLKIFYDMLNAATCDGGRKRRAGLKPSWKVDMSHEAALFSHLHRWKRREFVDPESGAHPLVHLAWRALAIAWQETQRPIATEPLGNAVDRSGLPPTISAHHDVIADALDSPALCGRPDCFVPLNEHKGVLGRFVD